MLRVALFVSVTGCSLIDAGGSSTQQPGDGGKDGPTGDGAGRAWVPRANLLSPRAGANLVAANGRIYAIAGGSYTTANHEYDPVADRWSVKAPLPDPGRAASGAAVVDGRIYMTGGIRSNTGCITENTRFDPAMNQWDPRTPASTYCRHGSAAVGTKVYLIGGTPAVVMIYDTVADSWDSGMAMPSPRYFLGVAALDTKIYAVGGAQPAAIFDTVESYDTVANTWSPETPMPVARTGLAAVAVRGKIYAIGGRTGGEVGPTSTRVDIYDPVARTWSPGPPLPRPCFNPIGAAVLDNTIYYAGCNDEAGEHADVFALTVD